MEQTEFLQSIGIFSTLSVEELQLIGSVCEPVVLDENVTVFNEGDPGDKLYLIESGVIDIKKRIPMTWGIETVRLARLQNNEIFGELSIFDGLPRSAGAVTFFKSKLLAIDKNKLLTLMQNNPTLASKILLRLVYELGRRIRGADESVRDLTRNLFHL